MNVYDFDNTIYDGESSVDFFLYCLKRKKSLIFYLPLLLYRLCQYKLRILSEEKLYKTAQNMTGVFLKYKKGVNHLVEGFWKTHRRKLKPYFLNRLEKDDVIISLSPRFLLDEIKNVLNVGQIICSEFDIKTGKLGFVCYKTNKVITFREMFPNEKINNFYTDSLNDSSMIEISKNAYLVNKNEITRIKRAR